LALFFGAQSVSSPFETAAQRVEVSPEALPLLRDAALALPRGPYVDALWRNLAELLTEKRMPDLVYEHVLPLALVEPKRAALDRAVARAFEELTMHGEAVPWFESALEASRYDIPLWIELAGARLRAGDGVGGVAAVREALAIQPGRADLERLLGMALVRAGEVVAGRELLEEALERDPDDEALRPYLVPDLEPGSLEPLGPEFRIDGGGGHSH
jgi:tetratricopeptide (TPR) repeat protein